MKVHYKIERLLPSTIIRLWQRIGRRGLLQLCVPAFVRIIIVVIFLIGVGLIFSTILLFVDVKIPFNRTTEKQHQLNCNPVRVEIDEKFFFGDLYATVRSGGVGNFVFEYIALLGIAKQLNRTPAIRIDNEKLLRRVVRKQEDFANLLDPIVIMKMPPGNNTANVKLTYNGCCVAFNASEVYAPYKNVTAVYSTLIYAQSFVYFDSLTRDEVLHMLQFSDSTLKTAELELVEPAKIKDTHNLCVHIRRGDYLRSRFHMPSTEPFTIAGTLYLVEKLRNQKQNRNISVIMLGNDLRWERNIFYNTAVDFPFYVANQSNDWVPHIDWAFSKLYCDTVLITAAASTYGWWLSYFSRGQDIYYNEKFSKLYGVEREMDQATFFPQDWTRLRLNLNGNTTTVSEVLDWEKYVTKPKRRTTVTRRTSAVTKSAGLSKEGSAKPTVLFDEKENL